MRQFVPFAALAALTAASPLTLKARAPQHHGSSANMNSMNMNKPMDMKSMGMGVDMGMSMAPKPKPVVREIPPLFNSPTNPTKRVSIRYGPYTMASANDTTLMPMPGMEDEGGVVDVMWQVGEPVKPCSNCVLKHGKATLTYLDGSPANLDSGAWLHHMTLATVGPGRRDYACPNAKKMGMGIIGGEEERFMVVHNDRNETFWGTNAADRAGYYLGDNDKLAMILELKNELNIPKEVYFWQEFEYLPGPLPSGWLDVKGLWLDAQPCGAMSSEIHPPTVPNGQFDVLMEKAWVAPEDAELLTTVGHLHDGGIDLEILVNNATVCTSTGIYGKDPAYTPNAEAITMGAQEMPHISHYVPCVDFGKVKKGDAIHLKARYDFQKNMPAVGKSKAPVGVMGIALTFLGVRKA